MDSDSQALLLLFGFAFIAFVWRVALAVDLMTLSDQLLHLQRFQTQ
jgi:hypothetical protein